MQIKMMAKNNVAQYWDIVQQSVKNAEKGCSIVTKQDILSIINFIKSTLDMTEKYSLKMVTAYFKVVSSVLDTDLELRSLLFENLLACRVVSSKDDEYYTDFWNLFSNCAKDDATFQEICIEKLQVALSNLIKLDSNNIEGLESFNHLTRLVLQFAQLREDRAGTVRQIFLVASNFVNLNANPLPLKMFRDLFLQGGIGFDVSQLLQKKSGAKFDYVWLIASCLNFKHLVSIANFLELKKQLVIFVETEVIPAIIVFAQEDSKAEFVAQLCEEIATRAQESQSYMYTLEYLIEKLIDPGEDYPMDMKPVIKTDDFKKIFDICASATTKQLYETRFQTKEVSNARC